MSAEWLFEAGIGEARAALVDGQQLLELAIERDGDRAHAAGAQWTARLTDILVPGLRGLVALGDTQALIEPLPAGATQGMLLAVDVVRAALPEKGRPRLAKVAAARRAPGREPGLERAAPPLIERLRAVGQPVRTLVAQQPDALEDAGWGEALDQARSGLVPFDGGLLTITPTPAMTLIDVDGAGAGDTLMRAGALAAARAVRLFGLAGSIGIDLPTVPGKAARAAADAVLAATLPADCARTAINGFGFVQLVRRRERPSIVELLQSDPVADAALALLRRVERECVAGPRALHCAPAVAAWLAARPALLAALEQRTGARHRLQPAANLAIHAGHVGPDAL